MKLYMNIITILLPFHAFFILISDMRPEALIVHSYHPEFNWTSKIQEVLETSFEDESVLLNTIYMDTKRNSQLGYLDAMVEEVVDFINIDPPQYLILIDDNAQLVSEYYLNTDIKIIFAGVNASLKTYGYDKAHNVVGILERTPIREFVETMVHVYPSASSFVHVSDDSITSRLIHSQYEMVSWEPFQCLGKYRIESFDSWKRIINSLSGVDFILLTHYHTVRFNSGGKSPIMPSELVLKWTIENTSIPIIGNWGFFVEDGGYFSIAVPAREQAAYIVNSLSSLLSGLDFSKLSVAKTREYTVYLNACPYYKARLQLPMIYELYAKREGHYIECRERF